MAKVPVVKLSTRARYALRMMVDIVHNGGVEVPVSLAAVAERTHLSRGYLEQLALTMRNAGLLRGVCGAQGGYRLARTAAEISVGDIVQAAIGRINIVECVGDPEVCMRTDYCECRPVYALINHRISEVLDSFSLASLIEPASLKGLTRPSDVANLAALTPAAPRRRSAPRKARVT
jgi:Rrf2 family protein